MNTKLRNPKIVKIEQNGTIYVHILNKYIYIYNIFKHIYIYNIIIYIQDKKHNRNIGTSYFQKRL